MKTMVTSQLPVMALEIDEEGTVAQKSMQLTRQGQLANTLLDALYPGIRVATVEIPGNELDDYGRAKVEQALARFTVGGVEYRLTAFLFSMQSLPQLLQVGRGLQGGRDVGAKHQNCAAHTGRGDVEVLHSGVRRTASDEADGVTGAPAVVRLGAV